tara:strand:+ start:1329 stop:1520 length:192 start_codon:yes stop_codon:yes gene_type:complete
MTWNRYWWPSKVAAFNIEILARFDPHKKVWEVALPSKPDSVFIEMPVEEWEKLAPRAFVGGEE